MMHKEEDVPVIVGCGQTKLGKLNKPIPQLVKEAFSDALAEADLHSECIKGLVAMPAVADLGKGVRHFLCVRVRARARVYSIYMYMYCLFLTLSCLSFPSVLFNASLPVVLCVVCFAQKKVE